MTITKKILLFVVILLSLILGFIVGDAYAWTIDGGTTEQREYANEVIEACQFPLEWVELTVGNIDIDIVDHHAPYWDILYEDDGLTATAAGLAWPGRILIHSKYEPGYERFFGEIVAHEMGHQVWYAMGYDKRQEWTSLCTVDVAESDEWLYIAAENHTEHFKVAYWEDKYTSIDYARTNLVKFDAGDTILWHEYMLDNYFTTHSPFTDLSGIDYECYTSITWSYTNKLILGFENNTFGPWESLLRRHVYLVAKRAGLEPNQDWENDYSEATRGDVRDTIPNLEWEEERWEENLVRSQLCRLMYRANQ
jgi:hypothetical protein